MAQTKLKGKQVETFTDTTEGVVPASGGGTTNFLRADGTWATPAGGGGGGLTFQEVMRVKIILNNL